LADGEYHVASYVVRTRPEHASAVAEHINAMPGLEVHGEEQGKLVVTAEAGNVRELADFTADLEQLDAVLTVAPVYHEYTGAGEAEQAILPDEK
jgi:nitrate reductase NapD